MTDEVGAAAGAAVGAAAGGAVGGPAGVALGAAIGLNPFGHSGQNASNPKPAGGHFEFSEADLISIRDDLRMALDKLEPLQENARVLASITPPADDPASVKVAGILEDSGRDYAEHSLPQQINVVRTFLKAVEEALPEYLRTEQDAKGSFGDSGEEI
ncbi:hypothetical protein EV191_101543 [Tamaricihabitans halophyticus]|uniref:PE family protein n=1 Tax=Tamaricihabitans halophyticus TaxID=1262583 RepID=A0A4R2R1M5_9PSEU|nr:hypothetical protein [Tamaricihabitans halophyticus]TCP56600.1 hypothetical protein EV191_101543 [Tamaricihabitans halophyticus]